MNKVSRIFSPYSLLIMGVFIEYFPAYFNRPAPSIKVGSVSLYITDIGFIFLCMYAFFGLVGGKPRSTSRAEHDGKSIQIIFGLFIVLSCIKWLLQTDHDISSIRTLITFNVAYAFLFFFPMIVTRKADLRYLQYLLIIFLVYIFTLHIYAFAIRGFVAHVLTGGFLTMLSLLYFLAVSGNHVLRLSSIVSFCVKALVIVTFIMVGHRSGFVGILLGLITLLFFNKKSAFKEITALVAVVVIGASVAMILSPTLLSKLSGRASTTFDTSQETYQLRYDQIFVYTQTFMEEHPIIGKPLDIEVVARKRITRKRGDISTTQEEDVIAPHNLFLEWLYYYGSVGLLLGLSLMIASIGLIRRFLAENKNDRQNYQIGVAALCCMAHNLFFALSNATAVSVFGTFFLYFPLVILVGVNRNKKIVDK